MAPKRLLKPHTRRNYGASRRDELLYAATRARGKMDLRTDGVMVRLQREGGGVSCQGDPTAKGPTRTNHRLGRMPPAASCQAGAAKGILPGPVLGRVGPLAVGSPWHDSAKGILLPRGGGCPLVGTSFGGVLWAHPMGTALWVHPLGTSFGDVAIGSPWHDTPPPSRWGLTLTPSVRRPVFPRARVAA